MAVKYSCFISYPHPKQGREFEKVITKLKCALEDRLGIFTDMPICYDKERLKPSYYYNNELSLSICESACMIVIFSSLYQSRRYCIREFMAMKQIEEKRKRMLGDKYNKNHSLIIPIVIKGDTSKDLPDKIKNIHYWDITNIINTGFNTRAQECRNKIIEIVNVIQEFIDAFKDLDDDCSKFLIPTEKDAVKSWGSNSYKNPKFPLRAD